MASQEGTSKPLLAVVHRFRHQSATFGSDKIYALLGLLTPDNPTRLIPDYSKSPEEVFVEFTISCIEHMKDLKIIALAAGTELQGVSWCRDWRLVYDGYFSTEPFVLYRAPRKSFSASGTSTPIYSVDIARRILTLKGFEIDVVAESESFHELSTQLNAHWDLVLTGWERTAGGPWREDVDDKRAFNQTITASCWDREPIDWRQRLAGNHEDAPTQDHEEYKEVIDEACENRRFFVTKKGKFGLGPWDVKKEDTVVILLGGAVTFVLRRYRGKNLRKRVGNEDKSQKVFWKVVGEAYLNGSMFYEGDIQKDIDNGTVELEDFHLL